MVVPKAATSHGMKTFIYHLPNKIHHASEDHGDLWPLQEPNCGASLESQPPLWSGMSPGRAHHQCTKEKCHLVMV